MSATSTPLTHGGMWRVLLPPRYRLSSNGHQFHPASSAGILLFVQVRPAGSFPPEIIEAAKRDAHVDIPEDAIKLEKPIKEVGTHEVPISAGEMFGKFSVIVEAEE